MVVRLRREYAVPRELAWRAFTEPGALASWFWPARLSPQVAADVEVGGRYRIAGRGSLAIGGEYRELRAPERLAFTWRWNGDSAESLVTIELHPGTDPASTEPTTEVAVRHEDLPDAEAVESHHQGWQDCLDRLPDWFATQRGAS